MVTLDTWEAKLKARLTGVDLIGELDLSPEETRELGALIRDLVKRSHDIQDGTSRLRRAYPCSFVTFLVFQGLYGYDSGDYWSSVCAATGIPRPWASSWGQVFETTTVRLGLRRQFAGHRYVGAILGHAGIPSRSLPDFFERMLQPSINKSEWAGLSSAELIAEWLSGSAHYGVGKPVLRFLEYGGQVAEDFVERCRSLAREYLFSGEMPTAVEAGLPESLLTHYETWIESRGETLRAVNRGLRLRSPHLLLDPWGLGVYLWLPEQQLPATQSYGALRWDIIADDQVVAIPLRLRRVDFDLKTPAVRFPLASPSAVYRARLYVNEGLLREWVLAGVSRELPLRIFDCNNGTPLPLANRRPLPAQRLWVIAAPDVTLNADPPEVGFLHERLPPLPWAWHDWQAYAIDLTNHHLFVWQVNGERHQVGVQDLDLLETIELVEGDRLPLESGAVPVFVGRPPAVRLPLPSSGPADASLLARWRIEVRSDWETDPTCRVTAQMHELQHLLRWVGNAVHVPLDHSAFLGPTPIGQYRVKVRGPLGLASELRFGIAPRLAITGHEQPVIPDPKHGAPWVELQLETDAHSDIQFLQDEPSFSCELISEDAATRRFNVSVPPDRTEAPLRLVYALGSNRDAYLPLRIPIERMRWLPILDVTSLANPQWQSLPGMVDLFELEQSEYPCLLVEVPAGDRPSVTVTLRFLDSDQTILCELHSPASVSTARHRRFDLRPARDALRQSTSAVMPAQLIVEGVRGHASITLTAFFVRRGIQLETLTVSPQWNADALLLTLEWHPTIPLKWRHVRFWSQTCPWREPVEFQLPDDAQQSFKVELPRDALPPAQYLVEFHVRDPWLPTVHPQRPLRTASNVAEVSLGQLGHRLTQLDALETLDFEQRCERLLLRRALGEQRGAEEDLQWCYEHLSNATMDQMMALAHELDAANPTAKAIRFKLYRAEQVAQMLQAFRAGRLSEDGWRFYAMNMPSLALQSVHTCKVLLDAPDDQQRLAAVTTLLKQGQPIGVEAVLAWAESGRLSEADTVTLLETNIASAAHILGDIDQTPLVRRVWESLARLYPDHLPFLYVRPGHWVRCQAGWGRVERIDKPEAGSVGVAHIDDLDAGYRLHVTLRPGLDSEPVMVDMQQRVVHFVRPGRFYLCTVCQHCAMANEHQLYTLHKKRHHEGETYGYRPVAGSMRQTTELEFLIVRPAHLSV